MLIKDICKMRKNANHARQFQYKVNRPTNTDSRELLRWLYANFGKSSIMDLRNGVWFFDTGFEYPYEPAYWFKYEKDAVYFRMTWE